MIPPKNFNTRNKILFGEGDLRYLVSKSLKTKFLKKVFEVYKYVE